MRPSIVERMDYLRSVPDGWYDGVGAKPTNNQIDLAQEISLALFAGGMPQFSAFPMEVGGVQLELYLDKDVFEIVVSERLEFYYMNVGAPEGQVHIIYEDKKELIKDVIKHYVNLTAGN